MDVCHARCHLIHSPLYIIMDMMWYNFSTVGFAFMRIVLVEMGTLKYRIDLLQTDN